MGSSATTLYSLVNLETLYIRGNDIAPDDILALQTMLPNCLVIHDVDMTATEEDPEPEETEEAPEDDEVTGSGAVSPVSGGTSP